MWRFSVVTNIETMKNPEAIEVMCSESSSFFGVRRLKGLPFAPTYRNLPAATLKK